MSETDRNPYARHNTDSLVNYLRQIAPTMISREREDKLDAAADRLHALYHAEPEGALSAGVLSESDAVRREREAFERGAKWSCAALAKPQGVERTFAEESAARYPLPQTRRPLRVTFSNGETWSYEPGVLAGDCRIHGESGHQSCSLATLASDIGRKSVKPAEDFAKLARILSGEMETVDAPSSAGNTTPSER